MVPDIQVDPEIGSDPISGHQDTISKIKYPISIWNPDTLDETLKKCSHQYIPSTYSFMSVRKHTSGTLPTFDIEGRTFDIGILREGETFDIEGRKMTFDIGYDYYDMTIRYRRF